MCWSAISKVVLLPFCTILTVTGWQVVILLLISQMRRLKSKKGKATFAATTMKELSWEQKSNCWPAPSFLFPIQCRLWSSALIRSFSSHSFSFWGFHHLWSTMVRNVEWKFPEINNSYVLNCMLFWLVWWSLTLSSSVLPGMWIIPVSGTSMLYTLRTLQSHGKVFLGYQIDCWVSQCLCSCNPRFTK